MLIGTESGLAYADTDSAKKIDVAKKQALNTMYGMFVQSNAIIEDRLCKLETHRIDFEPYLQRVLDEAKKLNTNIKKLRNHLCTKPEPDNPEFARLEMREEAFQRQQLVFMEGYLEMLLCRMEMWC